MLPQPQYAIMYSTPEGDVRVQAVIKDETMWLTQRGIATLFDVGVPAINKHINNIFKEGELNPDSVISILETVAHQAISHAEAEAKASEEYVKFKRIQKIISDFDLDFGLVKEE